MNIRCPVLILGALLAWGAAAQVTLPEPVSVRSQSGQFIVSREGPVARGPAASLLATNQQFLELEPSLLVVSCERIRQTVARELGLTAPWRGKIHVHLFPVTRADDPITLTAEQFRDDWNYRVHLPDIVERRRLMRALVQVVLLETANRQAAGRSAELPPWLAVGLAEHLLASAQTELLFAPPRMRVGGLNLSRTLVTGRRTNPLAGARARLSEHSPLTLQELSWPTENDFTGDTAEAYHASAHLFVTELLRLQDGPACLRALLQRLPQHLNWQTAFLEAFRGHFGRLLDVEKWWALQMVYFTGRDITHTWSVAESWQKLEAAIRIRAHVRVAPNQLPEGGAAIRLQTVVGEWDFVRQTPVLRTRLQQIELVRQRVAPELFPLAEDYRRLLADYLQQRDKLGLVLTQRRAARPELMRLIEETVRKLDALDARLETYRRDTPGLESPVTAVSP